MTPFISPIHLAATAGFCALLWVVQLVVYPQLARIRREDFSAHHARHMRAITWIVAPLFLLEGLGAAAMCWLGWREAPVLQGISVGLFAANSALTFLWFVPAHQRLALRGHDPRLLASLVWMHAWRTGMSTARVFLVVYMAT